MASEKAGGRSREDNTQEKHMMNDDGDNGGDVDGDDSWSYPQFGVFSPLEVCSRAGAWATNRITRDCVFTHKNFNTHRNFNTDKLLHREVFTHRSFCTQRLLPTEAST